ncbi:hypothetical protein WH7805_06471 [Synechococcus sp. WH 7805]|nr:hypothetical protein WH7805_06471 [Synechococcus sp. WH 7805]
MHLESLLRDFPGSQIRLLLHIAHTDNSKARENFQVVSTMLLRNELLLTGPHTFIALSFITHSSTSQLIHQQQTR